MTMYCGNRLDHSADRTIERQPQYQNGIVGANTPVLVTSRLVLNPSNAVAGSISARLLARECSSFRGKSNQLLAISKSISDPSDCCCNPFPISFEIVVRIASSSSLPVRRKPNLRAISLTSSSNLSRSKPDFIRRQIFGIA